MGTKFESSVVKQSVCSDSIQDQVNPY